ncbi:unnamed protein product [Didymodactylos carnosus]|uniref:F-box domain-containing protein n=1 Tax=Didymodactylos carnosus TaxID=1234261 RepID=A0A813YLH1_9BILA|nr:unnamed protein product [Didymodactylos carnosus]CAF1071640.1 unnamed protein product [Didymodactylos carnosus]CAF3671530.1 unnamed protein product [Didymodactylos carnosus]CAF3835911.1 unnamed protein product [Didymodactylos carnosus]
MSACFESFPTEIFLEMFDYLSGCDIYYSFSNLNSRLNSIIQIKSKICLDLSHVTTAKQFNFFCTLIVPQNILTLKLIGYVEENYSHCVQKCSYNQIDIFLSYFQLEEFIYLKSLDFFGIYSDNLKFICKSLEKLNYLTFISLSFKWLYGSDIRFIFRVILNLSSSILKYVTLNFDKEQNIDVNQYTSLCKQQDKIRIQEKHFGLFIIYYK